MKKHSFIIAATMKDGPNAVLFVVLAQRLSAQGHAVAFVSDVTPAQTPGLTPEIPVYYWPSKRPTHAADAFFLRRLIRERHATCLIANFGAVSLMMTMGRLLRVPYRIAWYRTLSSQLQLDHPCGWFRRTLTKVRKSWVYHCATHCVANSAATKQDLIHYFHVPSDRIHVHFNAVPAPQVPPVERERFKIICPGRLNPSKGQEVLIRAVANLRTRFPGLVVEFLGSGPSLTFYRELAAQLGVDGNCIFSGSVPRTTLLARMAGARLVVIPSLQEAFGLVAAEAMSVATPVIASRTGGLVEIVADESAGRLFTAGASDDLALKMAALLTDDAQWQQCSAGAKKRFQECFETSRRATLLNNWLNDSVFA